MLILKIIKGILHRIIGFLSDNFDLLLSLNIAFVIIVAALMLAVALNDEEKRSVIKGYVNDVFLIIIISIEAVLIMLMGHVYWKNYKQPVQAFVYPRDIIDNTFWAPAKYSIFYVNGGVLRSISINGNNERTLFTAKDIIKEFNFSPNGKKLIVGTKKEIYLLDLDTNKSILVDSLTDEIDSHELKGTFSSIKWSPDSEKFCYEAARWSQYSSQDNFYVYNLVNGQKIGLKSPNRRITSLHWDIDGENLYYMQYESKDTMLYSYPYEIKVYRMKFDETEAEFIASIPSDKSRIPFESLRFRDVKLEVAQRGKSFSRVKSLGVIKSNNVRIVGIDDSDHLFFIRNRWFRERLFKIPRVLAPDRDPRYQYLGGDLTIEQMAWIQNSPFVVIDDKQEGLLLLDPYKKKIGYIGVQDADFMGWYDQ